MVGATGGTSGIGTLAGGVCGRAGGSGAVGTTGGGLGSVVSPGGVGGRAGALGASGTVGRLGGASGIPARGTSAGAIVPDSEGITGRSDEVATGSEAGGGTSTVGASSVGTSSALALRVKNEKPPAMRATATRTAATERVMLS